jgi:DNA polymerase-1
MQYIMFGDLNTSKEICILSVHLDKHSIEKTYIDPFGLVEDSFMALSLYQDTSVKKTPVKMLKEYVETELLHVLEEQSIKYILCTDPEYFKILAGVPKADANVGYVIPCVYFPNMFVIFAPSYKSIFYDPVKSKAKIETAIRILTEHWEGNHKVLGQDIVHSADYPQSVEEISEWLNKLTEMDCPLTCDIEAFSLKHHTAGIGSISFAWNQHEGISFLVDYVPIEGAVTAPFGTKGYNVEVRNLLLNFFLNVKHKIIYHNIAYDAYVLIYQLFMKNILDTEGMLRGIDILLNRWEDTKLIAYLATNSCAGNELGLKVLAQPFAGNWAESDIKDILNIPADKLLRYNLIDSLSTWFCYNTYHPIMLADKQEELYKTLFTTTTVDIIQMQLTGMPLNMERVLEVKTLLEADNTSALQRINDCPLVQEYQYQRKLNWVTERNLKLKKKRVTLADAELELLKDKNTVVWNPNSHPQMQELLFEIAGLPVIEYTDSKLPATDGDTLAKLLNHTTDPVILGLLEAFIDYSAVNKILTSFIPAMENATLGPDGWHYLFGGFNLGGTISGRLSSSNP